MRKRKPAPPEPTPFDPEPGTVREVSMGRLLPRMFRVVFMRTTSTGWYYDVYDPHHRVNAMTKHTMYGTTVCSRCRKADDCLHAHAARKVHRQLWWL